MAIEMIEKSDFGNFSAGRLGLKSFADEDICENLDGSENFGRRGDPEQYFNLFGSKTRKDSIANVKREQDERWAAKPRKTCDDLRKTLGEVQIDIETLTKQSATSNEFWIQPALETARKWQGEFKKMRNDMDCDALEAKAKAEKEKAETLATLKQISDSNVADTKKDLDEFNAKQGGGEKVFGLDKNIVLYAGAGLGALIIFALILKK
jgi:hypothetical protein